MLYQLTSEIDDLKIAKITKFDPKCNSVIEGWNIDLDLKRSLQWYWFARDFDIFYGIKRIIKCEDENSNLKNNLLAIGCGPNGDELFVDTKTLEVLFWNHEEAEDYDNKIKSDCTKLYDHLLSLLVNIRNRNYIPWDSFAADEYYRIYKGV